MLGKELRWVGVSYLLGVCILIGVCAAMEHLQAHVCGDGLGGPGQGDGRLGEKARDTMGRPGMVVLDYRRF